MKDNYDFSKGRRGRVVAEPPPEPGKVRITIRLDEDLPKWEETLRRIIREEMNRNSAA